MPLPTAKKCDWKEMHQSLAEQLLWESCNNCQELFAKAMGLACRVLDHMTDEETAADFNKKTGKLFYDAIRQYAAKTNGETLHNEGR